MHTIVLDYRHSAIPRIARGQSLGFTSDRAAQALAERVTTNPTVLECDYQGEPRYFAAGDCYRGVDGVTRQHLYGRRGRLIEAQLL